jgi:ankyrin repeat protein
VKVALTNKVPGNQSMIFMTLLSRLILVLMLLNLPGRAGDNAIVSQQPALALPANTAAEPLGLRWSNGWMLAPVTINHIDAGWFKIATGWGISCIDPKLAKRLKLVTVPQCGLLDASLSHSSPGGTEVVYRVDNFQCGAAKAEDLWLHGVEMESMSSSARELHGEGISGVIGWDLLRSLPFTLDYGKLGLTWRSELVPPEGAHREVLLRDQKLPMIGVTVGDGVKATALINTVFGVAVSVRPGFVTAWGGKLRTGRRTMPRWVNFEMPTDDDQILSEEYAQDQDTGFWTKLEAFNIARPVLAQISKTDDLRYGDLEIGYSFLRSFCITFDGPGFALWTEPLKTKPEVQFLNQTKLNHSPSSLNTLWYALIVADDVDAVRAFLESGVSLESADPGILSPLAHACACGARSTALALIEAGAKVDPFPGNRDVVTPLICASRLGEVELMRALINAGANPTRSIGHFETPLIAAAGSGDSKAVDYLLTKMVLPKDASELSRIVVLACASGNLTLAKKAWVQLPAGGRSQVAEQALIRAALDGQVPSADWLLNEANASTHQTSDLPPLLAAIYSKISVKTDEDRRKLVAMLLEEGANPNVTKRSVTPLLLAAKHGDAEIVKMLLKAGAKGTERDFKGLNVIERAAAANQPADLLAPLLTLGLNLNDLDSTTDRTALGTYAFHGNTEACRILLDASADPNFSTFTSPALVFATNGRRSSDANALATMALLLERGAKVTFASDQSLPGPLFGAVASSRSSLIEPLVKGGADLNKQMFNGVTAVGLAAAIADLPTFMKIIELGGDPHTVDRFGASAVAHAASAGRVDNMKLLLEQGASPNAEHPDDLPPLVVAASFGQLASVKILINAKADVDAKNPKTGDSANGIAKQRGDTVMLKVLQEAGAL